ncbi:MAG: hypothetical protein H6706_21915 [Myxococcales bacterium]|nr:hypothetical protein [Myxococcales bacterium]
MGYPVRHLLLALVMGLVGLGAAYAAKPLTQVHAHLDKQEECNRCHVAFGGVPEEKCRSCHLDIDRRVKANQGFHGREAATVKCYDCHREHLGRGHDITGLDRDRFDHRKTGWPLTGNHEQVRCRSCHTAKRPQTGRDSYLGASTRCADCHGEYHGQARKSDLGQCDRCHNTYGWEQLNANLRFDHERETRFPRTGKHMQVECAKCHQGKRAFGPIAVQSCTTCHADPHPPGIFRERICDECHVTKGWKDASAFSHASTGWPLKGRHQKVECLNCHSWKKWKPRTKDCAGCHDDAHRGQFAGTPCGRCHQESGFKNLVFNHDTMSRFPLRGRHRRVDCARCHPGGKYKPVEDTCESCHGKQNPHGDTFEGRPCANCHSPVDWKQTRFDHGITGFPLAGQHEDQPCYRCHPEGTETQVDTPPDCDWCHQDLHRGQFEQRACDDCHKGFERFSIPLFDHTVARFQLQGKHLDVSCDGCHKDGHYRPIDTACANCHQNFHAPQFEKKCEECHTAAAWSEEVFDHDRQSDYRLAGQHRRIDCAKCHVQNDYKGIPQACEGCHLDVHAGTKGPDCDRCHTAADWTTNRAIDHDFGAFSLGGAHDRLPCERCHGENREIQLAGTGPECVGCHKDPHFGSLGPFCHDCHSQDQFLPSTFLHDRTGFRLSGSHRFVACRDCHPGRVYGGLPSTCDFCHTDTFQRTAGTDCDHPAQCANGVSTCQTCHTTLGFLPARPGSACGTCEAGGRR